MGEGSESGLPEWKRWEDRRSFTERDKEEYEDFLWDVYLKASSEEMKGDKYNRARGEVKRPLKAIQQKCLDCSGDLKEVRLCTVVKCPLWPYRFGTNPPSKKRKWSKKKGA